ncbi:hemin uptake protein HemP [Acidovorax sp. sif1233]|uniref:hemin uptake protein HemP n=1 Tax=Acidovorax sp. sif1233 TaxID=2854792 RepID=UPI001C4774EE|nr:hemin uptake protein HemP [Acidovorax sp. sif1233]MBV7457462.1 hemin uptake protein HemP [Acidovorax sp. sif1233]
MQATLTAASILRPASASKGVSHADGLASQRTEPSTPTAAVDSSSLLQGQKAVAISHNGSVYRLQATKLGKLILTK